MQDINQPKTALPNSDSMAIEIEQQSLKISDLISQVSPESEQSLTYSRRYSAIRWLTALCSCFRSVESSKPNLPADNQASFNLLTPQSSSASGRKTLVLDLDETLVHSTFQKPLYYDIHLKISINNMDCNVYVLKRPGVDQFLERMAEIFEIVLFTASVDKYANPLIDMLDTNRYIHSRLYRTNCTQFNGSYVKDLSKLGRSLKDVIIIDNSPMSYLYQPDNALPIKSWFSDPQDCELMELVPVLEYLADLDDVTQTLSKIRKKRGINITGRQIREILGLEECSMHFNSQKKIEAENILQSDARSELNSPIYRSVSSQVFRFNSSEQEEEE